MSDNEANSRGGFYKDRPMVGKTGDLNMTFRDRLSAMLAQKSAPGEDGIQDNVLNVQDNVQDNKSRKKSGKRSKKSEGSQGRINEGEIPPYLKRHLRNMIKQLRSR